MAARHQSAVDYLGMVERDPATEISAWARELTVTETYFLRHIEQFNALTGDVLNDRRRAGRDPARLSLLSAGCATGEEAYSLAICLRQHNPAAQPSIRAVDVNPAALEHAGRARYTPWSLRAVPESVRQRWFSAEQDEVRPDPSVTTLVRFQQHNIMLDDPDVWRPEAYDVVFCRNVLMYLRPAVMEQVVRRIAISLMPGGFLFLGSAETLRGLSTAFTVRESHGAFYYQRTAADPVAVTIPAARSSVPRPPARATGPTRSATTRSSVPGRVPPSGTEHPAHPAHPEHHREDQDPLAGVLELFRLERFTQALTLLHDTTTRTGAGTDPEPLLLRAALLTHSGQLDAAEQASRQLLRIDPASAGAHLLLAIVRECEADDEAAIAHCHAAIRLDPQFAMPQVHLGRLAKRAGQSSRARQYFSSAVHLLPRENGRRLMLFGGGFTREALMSMCRTQLAQLETGS